MKKTFILFLLSTFVMGLNAQIFHCGDQIAKKQMSQRFGEYHNLLDKTFLDAKHNISKSADDIYTIPVVVHVVYNTQDQNISDELIHDQIETLNRDFRRMNADAIDTRPEFQSVAGDAFIEFELASIDPTGSSTNGITRTQTTVETFADLDFTAILSAFDSCGIDIFDPASIEENFDCLLEAFGGGDLDLDKVKRTVDGGVDPWDTERYMNIWVCNMGVETGFGPAAPFILGFAYPPVGAPNWEEQGLPDDLFDVDGVVIHYEAIGPNNPNAGSLEGLNDLGRTCVHEVGHYLGLRHIWGDGDCDMDDGISDTPTAAQNAQATDLNYNCLDFHGNDTCLEDNLPDMVENYMDYSPESCQNVFTDEQIGIMRAMLEGPRIGLIGNSISSIEDLYGSEDLKISPNPTNNFIEVSFDESNLLELKLLSSSGQVLKTSKTRIINLYDLEPGVFYLKVSTNDGYTYVRQIVKL